MPTEEERRLYEDMRRRLGLAPPASAEQGLFGKITQPIRTFFGATQGIGGRALGALFPEEYERAQEEMRQSFGVGATAPWYRQLEAAPGVGDVAAQLVPEEVRESAFGKAVGPVGRMAGNILGDPTTYTPAIVGRAAGAITRSIPAGAKALKMEERARKVLTARRQAGALAPELANKAIQGWERNTARVVLEHGGPKAAAYKAARAIRMGEPLTLGGAAAIAYGPSVVGGAMEGARAVAEAESLPEAAAAGVNTALMTGMAVLMGKGLVSGRRAWQALSEDIGRNISLTPEESTDVIRALRGEPPARPALPERATVPEPLQERVPGPPAVSEMPPVQGPQWMPGQARLFGLTEEGLPGVEPRPIPEVPPEVRMAAGVPEGQLPLEFATPEAAPRGPERPVAAISEAPPAPTPPVAAPEASGEMMAELGRRGMKAIPEKDGFVVVDAEGAPVGFGDDLAEAVEDAWTTVIAQEAAAPLAAPPVAEAPRPAPQVAEAPIPEAPPIAETAPGRPTEITTEPGVSVAPEEADYLGTAIDRFLGSKTDRAKGRMTDEIADRFQQKYADDPEFRARIEKLAEGAEGPGQIMPKLRQIRDEIQQELDIERETGVAGEAAPVKGVEAPREQGELPGTAGGAIGGKVRVAEGGKLTKRQAQQQAFTNLKDIIEAGGDKVGDALDAYIKLKAGRRFPRGTFNEHRQKLLRETVALMDGGMTQDEAIKQIQHKYGGGRTIAEDIRPFLKDFVETTGKAIAGTTPEIAARAAAVPSKAGATTLERLRAGREEVAGALPRRGEAETTAGYAQRLVAADLVDRAVQDLRIQGEAAAKGVSRQVTIPHAKEVAAGVKASVRARAGLLDHWKAVVAKAMGRLGATADEISAAQKQLADAWAEGQTKAKPRAGAGAPVIKEGQALPTGKPMEAGRIAEAPATFKLEGYKPVLKAGRAEPGRWQGKNGTRVEVAGDGENVKLIQVPDQDQGVTDDVRRLLSNDSVQVIDIDDVTSRELNRLSRELPDGWSVVTYGNDRAAFARDSWLKKKKAVRIEEMPARWRMQDVILVDQRTGRPTPAATRMVTGMLGDDASIKPQIDGRLKDLDITLESPDELFEYLSKGAFHNIFEIKGSGPNGERYILRVGKAPHVPLPTAEQQMYVQKPVGAPGKIRTLGEEFNYTVHRKGYAPTVGVDMNKIAPELRSRFDIPAFVGRDVPAPDPVEWLQLETYMAGRNQLPPGVGLSEFLNDMADLYEGAKAAGLQNSDFVIPHPVMPLVRGNQVVYTPLRPGEAPSGVMRYGNDGTPYRLEFSDYGAVEPVNPPAGSPWRDMTAGMRVSLLDAAPGSALSYEEMGRRYANYQWDYHTGQAIEGAEGLRAVNHDRLASDDYVSRVANTFGAAADGLRRVADDIVRLVNGNLEKGMEPLRIRFGGLTTSPHLSGVFVGGEKTNDIFVNIVEAMHQSASREDAIKRAYYTLAHEISHNNGIGHDATQQTLKEYIDHLVAIEGKQDEYLKMIGDALPEDVYRRGMDEFVPEFIEQRRPYGESWRQPAEGVTRVPPGDLAGRVATEPNRGGRGAQGPPSGRGYGVQPGRAVPGGGAGQAGELRAPAAAGERAAAGPAQGEAARLRAGRGAAQEAGGYPEVVRRIEELHPDGPTIESAHRELDGLLENIPRDKPVNEYLSRGWTLAGEVLKKLSPAERAKSTEVKPVPLTRGEVEGPVNLTHIEGLSDDFKTKVKIWWELTKKGWPRSHPERWDSVSHGVQQMLGAATPEEWVKIVRNRKRPLKTEDIFILQQAHDDLATRIAEAEGRFGEAVEKGIKDEATLQKLWDEIDNAERGYHHAAFELSKQMTGAARIMAAGRRMRRASDPRVRWEQDVKAGLRERLRTEIKDEKERERVATDLFDQLTKIQSEGGDWEDFYKALRMMHKSPARKTRDMALEWYKAGLIGWPSRVANLTSNTLFRMVRYAEDTLAAGLDFARHHLTGSERENFLGEAKVGMLAMRKGFMNGGRKWVADFKNALMLQPEDMAEMMMRGGIAEDLMHVGGAIPGKAGRFVRFHLRGLSADDVLAKEISRMDTYYREVYRRIRKGEAFFKANPGEDLAVATERIASNLIDNFNAARNGEKYDTLKLQLFDPIAKAAEEKAKGDTFQTDLGSVGRSVQTLLRGHAWPFQIIFPFVRTPTNIFKETVRRTPLGLAEVAWKWKDLSKAEQMTALSKPLMGTAIGAFFLNQAMDGGISGGGPVNPDERETLQALGWQPYSFRFGDEGGGAQWIAYNRLEPVASIIGMAADWAEGARHGDFRNYQAGVERVMNSVAENLTNKTFLSGLDGMLAAMSHPKQFLPRFIRQMTASVVPNSIGFVPFGHLARALDPVYRSTNAFEPLEVAMSKVPFGSQTLDPQYAPTGDTRLRPGTFGERLILPFARRTEEAGPKADAAREIVRLGATPRAPSREWISPEGFRVEYTPEERAAMAKALEQATMVIGQRLLKDPSYQRLPDNEMSPGYRFGQKTKEDVVRNLISRYRRRAMDRVKPGLRARARQEHKEYQETAEQEGWWQ